MKNLLLKSFLTLIALLMGLHNAESGIVVIAHENTPIMDANTIARLYMGKAIEVQGNRMKIILLQEAPLSQRESHLKMPLVVV